MVVESAETTTDSDSSRTVHFLLACGKKPAARSREDKAGNEMAASSATTTVVSNNLLGLEKVERCWCCRGVMLLPSTQRPWPEVTEVAARCKRVVVVVVEVAARRVDKRHSAQPDLNG